MRVVNYSNTFMIRCIDPVVVPELVAGTVTVVSTSSTT